VLAIVRLGSVITQPGRDRVFKARNIFGFGWPGYAIGLDGFENGL